MLPEWIDGVSRDLRLAVRSLRAAPGFTIVTIFSLGLGLTLAASTVAVFNAYLIQPIPYAAPDRLYHVMYAPPGPLEPGGMSAFDWSSVRDVVEFPVTASGATLYLRGGGYARPARGLRVGKDFLTALGVRAVLGRTLSADDFGAGEQPVMIGNALWRDRFGGDPSAIGQTFTTDVEESGRTETFRVVGVLPPGFWFGRESSVTVDVLAPLRTPARTYVARLREGVPIALAERRLTDAARAVATSLPPNWTGVHLESMRERYVSGVRPVLVGITIAAGIVLAIACTNVAVLVLLRAMRRQKEISVRMALGAGRRHIVRLLAAECALLCAASLLLVIVLTAAVLRVAAPLIEAQLGRPAPAGVSAIGLDPTMFVALALTAVAIALSLSLVPLAAPWTRRLAEMLGQPGVRGSDGAAMRRIRGLLIAGELAGSFVLLAGCGMMIRSVRNMLSADLGYRTDGVVALRVVVPNRIYPDAAALRAFHERIISQIGGRATIASWPPYAESMNRPFAAEGGNGQVQAGVMAVGSEYFDVFQIRVIEGRTFRDEDREGADPVAVVSERLARRLWPGGSAIGRRFRTVDQPTSGTLGAVSRTVVGVVDNVRQTYTDTDVDDVYIPAAQSAPGRYASFYIRTPMPAPAFELAMRKALAQTDPSAVVRDATSVTSDNRTLGGARFLTWLLTGFAVFAALLAIVGMHGVIAYAVLQRRREFAIRIAIGATAQAVTALSMRGGGAVLAVGIGAGVLGAGAAGRLLQSRLYGVPALDVATMVAASFVMAAAGGLAIWWPARRAARVDPVSILKET